mmetsp:Transcript_5100/g.7777  ORF Transcript_5100/g.7777 Transcript_5100/m.7777 type:complete len:628 (-) Transcript_5100:14-1897(-)
MSQLPEPWEMEGEAKTEEVVAKKDNVPVERVKYFLQHLQPGAPKVGRSANNTDEMVQSASHAVEDDVGVGDEDEMWRSAMDRYQHEQQNDNDFPPTLFELDSNQQQNQYNYERINNTMDRMGNTRMVGLEMEMGYDEPPTRLPVAQAEAVHDDIESLSLWQTFRLLYRKHPTIKYYAAALLVLLIAAAIILGVSLSNRDKNCAVAKYEEKPFIILPDATGGITFREFGTSISSSAEFLIIGAPDPSSAQNITVGGGAFLYQRTGKGEWTPYSRIILDDGKTRNDKFGESVSISEDSKVIVVGAPRDDRLGVTAGAIYIIESPFSSSTPPQRQIPNDLAPNDEFGESVGVSTALLAGNIRVTNVVASAPGDDDFGLRSGAVYVYSKYYDTPPSNACGGSVVKVGEWVQCQKLVPDDGAALDRFGSAVAISGKTAVVGAEWDKAAGRESGSAYAFQLGDDGIWSLQEKITGWSSKPDRFGSSVSTSGNRIIIGADFDGSQGEGAGASYVYRLENGVWKLEQTFLPPNGSIQYRCGSSVKISPDGRIIMIGCPDAGDGGFVYVYHLSEQGGKTSWVQLEKFAATDGDLSAAATTNMMLGDSLAVSQGDNLLLVAGYGERNGEVFTYRQDC